MQLRPSIKPVIDPRAGDIEDDFEKLLTARANVRVMVPNVDECWRTATDVGARVIIPIGDRYYGLRDFTIADPDGFGIRFATHLNGAGPTGKKRGA